MLRGILCLFVVLCSSQSVIGAQRVNLTADNSTHSPSLSSYNGKTILWVSSYHRGYEANDDVEQGLIAELKNSGVSLYASFMDTKRNDSVDYGVYAANRILFDIEALKPDVIIASDDNAQRFLVEPYLKNGDIPVVFCGVNWDASKYGYPAQNITGMVEVDLTASMFHIMKGYAEGDRIGYVSGNVEAERDLVEIYNRRFFNNQMKPYLVNTMSEFKEAFLKAQRENDMLYFYNYTGISDWDPVEAELFITRNIRKPLGSHNDFMSRFVIFVVAKSLEEHGRYAAKTALKILDGTSPQDIALTENKQAELYVNLRLAKAASFVLPVSLLKTASVVGRMEAYLDPEPGFFTPDKYKGRKVVWVDSYHRGYKWSDAIERGIRNTFYDTGVELEVVRMNTLKNKNRQYMQQAGHNAYQRIGAAKPDLVIASDDNAQEFLILPYLSDTETPVIFCGLNRSLDKYGYPTEHITGMLEVQPVKNLQNYLEQFAKGPRVGFIAGDMVIQRELADQYNDQFYNGRLHTWFVKSMKEFKETFLQAQNEVDMLIFATYIGIDDWESDEARHFIMKHNTIPTGAFVSFMEPYVIFSVGKLGEEQGYFAAKTALRVLDGERPSEIPVAVNHLSNLFINIDQANSAKLVLPYRLLRSAKVVGKHNEKMIN